MVLSACASTQVRYSAPELNEADQARLDCPTPIQISAVLANLPAHVFLADSQGNRVTTPNEQGGTDVWVRFDIANSREEVLIRQREGEGGDLEVAFTCRDNLIWVAGVIEDLGED